ncbi:MAG TPA: hypothetical protein PLJ83_00580, partial [Spirochaetales bacterium]|nr:hypothetical protein [Spirochaetales bacterium]
MIKLFFPLKHRENLPIEFIKRVPILINTNFILILYFVFASFTRYRADPEATRIFFIAVLASCSSFVISLMLIRFKHYIIASTFSMLGIFLNSLWIGILLPLTNYMDLYRFSVYIIAASTVNILLSFRRLQIWLYSIT